MNGSGLKTISTEYFREVTTELNPEKNVVTMEIAAVLP
jgi:hypothetical protein